MSTSQSLLGHARLDPITSADFETLVRLAEAIWRAHYTDIVGSAQIEYMLAQRNTPEKLRLYLKPMTAG